MTDECSPDLVLRRVLHCNEAARYRKMLYRGPNGISKNLEDKLVRTHKWHSEVCSLNNTRKIGYQKRVPFIQHHLSVRYEIEFLRSPVPFTEHSR